jgi:hypothetical protein
LFTTNLISDEFATGVLSVNVVADPFPVIVWVDMDLN